MAQDGKEKGSGNGKTKSGNYQVTGPQAFLTRTLLSHRKWKSSKTLWPAQLSIIDNRWRIWSTRRPVWIDGMVKRVFLFVAQFLDSSIAANLEWRYDGISNGNSNYGVVLKPAVISDTEIYAVSMFLQGTADISSRSKTKLGGQHLGLHHNTPKFRRKKLTVSTTLGNYKTAQKFYSVTITGQIAKGLHSHWCPYQRQQNDDYMDGFDN